jgi:hypothetical protein
MRLATLLAELPDDELHRLGLEHVRTDEPLPRPQLCNFLEGAIRSYRFVSDFIFNRQPPAFSILSLLLDAPGYRLSEDGFASLADADARGLASRLDKGDLVARDAQLQLYRRALCEARRNDLDLNSSEAAILALLRRECGITQVEHFLIEHHHDLREFWDRPDSFQHEVRALRSVGLLFVSAGWYVLPEDVAPAVWQTLGIDMPTESARRLFGYLSNDELAVALRYAGARTSGTKEARLERLLAERVQPRLVLPTLDLSTLRSICRDTDAPVSGNKDDLIERIIAHFAEGKDVREEEPTPQPLQEPRQLSRSRFETLFSALLHQELSDILRRFPELRQTGTKEIRIATLWDAHLAEDTLLGELMNRQLEDVLLRLGLKLGGSKAARVQRIVDRFAGGNEPYDLAHDATTSGDRELQERPMVDAPDVVSNQAEFRQRASNPNVSLRPWLEELIAAPGLVRCYATEVPNPTQQLKNKLSQAAAAQGGVLVLLLADEDSFLKAREALVERWMTNPEWPKGVAVVALAYPLAEPLIHTLIERVANDWVGRIVTALCPRAEVVSLEYEGAVSGSRCGECSQLLPVGSRFCSRCGSRVEPVG